MVRGKGHLPSLYVPSDPRIDSLLASRIGSQPVPSAHSLRWYMGLVNDQSITSSCVAQAGTKAFYASARLRGIALPEISAMASYAITRGASLTSMTEPLVDNGSAPRDFFVSAKEYGVVAERRWPFDPAKINDSLPEDIFEAGVCARIVSFHSFDGAGADRNQAMRASIFAGSPVCFAMPVDRAYEDLVTDDVYQGRTGDSLGGHYQIAFGYGEESGQAYFDVMGSWGIGFGKLGYVRIAADYMGDAEVTDLFAIAVSKGSPQ